MEENGAGLAGARPTPDPWAPFDRWSSNLFLLLAVVGLLVALTVVGLGASATPAEPLLLGLVLAGVTLAVLVATSMGLDRGRAWARPAAVGLLWTLVAFGVARVILDLIVGRFTVPLEAIAAFVVLGKRPGPLPPVARGDVQLAALVVLVQVAISLLSLGASVLRT